jgi:hypothetical protein
MQHNFEDVNMINRRWTTWEWTEWHITLLNWWVVSWIQHYIPAMNVGIPLRPNWIWSQGNQTHFINWVMLWHACIGVKYIHVTIYSVMYKSTHVKSTTTCPCWLSLEIEESKQQQLILLPPLGLFKRRSNVTNKEREIQLSWDGDAI